MIAPAVYGGKLRRILAYVDPMKLQARNLSPLDVVNGIRRQNVMIPTGNARFGDYDVQVDAQGMLPTVPDLDGIPIKTVNGVPVLLRDVARAEPMSSSGTPRLGVGRRPHSHCRSDRGSSVVRADSCVS